MVLDEAYFEYATDPDYPDGIELMARAAARLAHGHGLQLRLAAFFERVEVAPGFRDRPTAAHQAVIAEDDIVVLPQVGDDPLALVQVGGRPLIVVIAEPVVKAQFVLGERQDAFGQARGRHALDRVGVGRADQVVPGHVDARMNGEARSIDTVTARIQQHVAVHVHLDQRRGGDLREHHAERVQQEVVVRSWHAGGEVGAAQVGEAVPRRQAVECREFDADFPLLRRDLVLDGRGGRQIEIV